MSCSATSCSKPAAKSGLCWMHLKRKQRGTVAEAPEQERLTPSERVTQAALDLADADTDDDDAYALAVDTLRKAVDRWYRQRAAQRDGRKRWLGVSKQTRSDWMRRTAYARWKHRATASKKTVPLSVECEPARIPGKAAPGAGQRAGREAVHTAGDDAEYGRTEQSRREGALPPGEQRGGRVRPGSEREPGRLAEDGQGDPRAGALARPGGAGEAGGTEPERGRAGGLPGGGSGARQSGPAAVRGRGRQARGDP